MHGYGQFNNGFGLQPNTEVATSDLQDINTILRANAYGQPIPNELLNKGGIGYPIQGVEHDSGTNPGSLWGVLAPQSLEEGLINATYTAEDLQFWKMIAKKMVGSTLHEYNRLLSHGSGALDPFFMEGRVGAFSEPFYERKTVRVKYMMEMFQYTDIANMVGIRGMHPTVLAELTERGTMSLLRKVEQFLIWADSQLSPLHFDGFYAQIRRGAPNNYTDCRGKLPSFEFVNKILAVMVSPNLYANPNIALGTYRHVTAFQNKLMAFNIKRFGEGATLWNGPIEFHSPRGPVKLVGMSFLEHPPFPTAISQGDGFPAATTPTVTRVAAGGLPSDAVSKFLSEDVGGGATATGWDYYYMVEAAGDEGVTPSPVFGPFNPTEPSTFNEEDGSYTGGDGARIDIPDSALPPSGTGSVRSYRVFRAKVRHGGTAPSDVTQFKWIGSFGRNRVNSNNTRFWDFNHRLPDTAPLFVFRNTADVVRWIQFLDLTRRVITIARTTTEQFALILMGALDVPNPQHCWIFDNVPFE